METIETNVVFPDKNIKTRETQNANTKSYIIEYDMINEEKLKVIKDWYEDYKNTKTFNLFLNYNNKTYNLYSFSLNGGDIKIYFTYSDESKTYGFGMEVMNINNEFPTFITDNPDFDISTLIKQEGSGGTGTNNYDELQNKPSINGVTLQGNLTTKDLGIESGGTNDFKCYILTSNNIQSASGFNDQENKSVLNQIYNSFINNEKFTIMIKFKTSLSTAPWQIRVANNIVINTSNNTMTLTSNSNTDITDKVQLSIIRIITHDINGDWEYYNSEVSYTNNNTYKTTYIDEQIGNMNTLLEAI